MDLGDSLQAAEVAVSVLSLLITSIGAYVTWIAANGMPLLGTQARGPDGRSALCIPHPAKKCGPSTLLVGSSLTTPASPT
jgi:hypothetical protein